MQALNLALNGKVTDHVIPSFKKIDSFLKEWNIGVKDQRDLFLTIANILKENKRYIGTPKHKFSYPLPICDYICSFILVALLHIFQLCGFFCKSSSGKDSFKFSTKYLATFSGEDSYTMSEAKEEAVRTVIEFVKAPDMLPVTY